MKPSFSILDGSGNKLASIRHCTLRTGPANSFKVQNFHGVLRILGPHNNWYEMVLEPENLCLSSEQSLIIVSFQSHTFGRFAIVRIHSAA